MKYIKPIIASVLFIIFVILFITFSVPTYINKPTLPEKIFVDSITIQGGPYKEIINIIITDDTVTAFKYITRRLTDVSISELRDVDGITFFSENVVVIWLHTTDPSVAVHELFHATAYTLQRSGVRLNQSTDEVYAYEQEWLFTKYMEHFK